MPHYNRITLMGHVGKDASELKRVGSKETALISFSLAVSRGKDKPSDWFLVKVWGKSAECWDRWGIRKGEAFFVSGTLQIDDVDGKRYVSVMADQVERVGVSKGAADKGEENADFPF